MEDILGDILGTSPIASLGGAPRSGSTLFVINLCASMAPIAVPGKTLPGLESYRLYQVARVEDGRPRHRLRLGFFQNEADAEGVLESVRARYPTAFTTCLSEDDRRFARGFLPASMQDASDTTILRNLSTVMANVSSVATTGMFKVGIAADTADTASTVRQPALKIALAQPTSEVTRETEQPIKAALRHPTPTTTPLIPDEISLDDLSWSPDEPSTTSVRPTSASAGGTQSSAALPTPKVVAAHANPAADATAPAKNAAASVTPAAAALPATKVIAAKSPAFKSITAPKLPEAPKPILTAPKALIAAAQSAASIPAAAAPKAVSQIPALPISLAIDPPAATAAPAAAAKSSGEPFRVDRGIQVPQTGLSLEAEVSQAPAIAPLPPATKTPATAASAMPAKVPPKAKSPAPSKPAKPAAARPTSPAAAVTDLDSTQTIRALTAAELNDSNQPKWFVVQLAISEQAINLDTMPHLDIFSAYRLYSVATAGSGKILHSLRLGFFKEEVSAQAVTGYLKTFFSSPSVIRIAASEQSRFADPPATKEIPATPAAAPVAAKKEEPSKIIELREVRDRIGKALEIPTVTMEIESPTGTHKKLPAKSVHKHAGAAVKRASSPAAKGKTVSTGKHRSLQEDLVAEARNLSASAIRKLPKNDSLLSKLVDKLKK